MVTDDECQLNLHQPEPNQQSCYNINTLRECLEKTETELQRLRAENERLENGRILLEDRANYFEKMCNEKESEILSLSTKIEVLKLRNSELESERSNETYKAKTQRMSNLEDELKRVHDESKKTIRQLQKKIKRLQESHAKSKQDYALKVFALKDEKKKLTEENEALEDRLRLQTTEESKNDCVGPDEDPSCTPRNQLIIQLSQQITTLDVENEELRQELDKTKRLLQKFELKERGIRSKSRTKRERQELCVNVARFDFASSTSKVELHG